MSENLEEQRKHSLELMKRDHAIGKEWCNMNRTQEPVDVVTGKRVRLTVVPHVLRTNKVEYYGYLTDKIKDRAKLVSDCSSEDPVNIRIAKVYCSNVLNGWVQITSAEVHDYENEDGDITRKGIGTEIYDRVEADIKKAGGKGVMPHWGSMSDDAIAFWKHRRPDQDIDRLNSLYPSEAEREWDSKYRTSVT